MNYYKTIEGKKMDNRLIEIAREATEGAGDGRISHSDARKILAFIQDGEKFTEVERETIAYIRHHFNWTEAADEWFRDELSRWRSPSGKLNMTPAEIATQQFPAFDVLKDPEKRAERNHDLVTAMAETQMDHDDIGLIVQLATGERVEVMCNFIEMSGDFVELKGGHIIPVRAIEKVEI
jgi:NACalpha-BTF3-like transcription factor